MNHSVDTDLSFSTKLKNLSGTTSFLLETLIILLYFIDLRDIDKSRATCLYLHHRK